ncbi:MAG: alpha/beta hydrolase [Saprospiraceae bacterium]
MASLLNISLSGFRGVSALGDKEKKHPPLLFIHGAFADHCNFENWLSFFAQNGYDALALSRRGRNGIGPHNASGLNFQDYLDDVIAQAGACERKPILIGHSLGGLLAMKAAEAGHAAATVLVCSAPPAMLTAQLGSLPSFIPMMPGIFLGRPILPSYPALRKIAFNAMPEADAKRLALKVIPESGIVYRQMLLGAIRLDSAKHPCPALCIGAGQDRIISKGLYQYTAKSTNATLLEYPKHGHFIMEEPGAEKVAGDILAWLRSL